MTNRERIQYLFDLYYDRQASEAEVAELMSYAASDKAGLELLSALMQEKWETLSVADAAFTVSSGQPILNKITGRKKTVPLYRYGWAAAVLAIVAVGAALYIQRPPLKPVAQTIVLPGSNKATLTLADGSVVPLDSSAQRAIPQANAWQKNGQLVYNTTQQNGTQVSYNTLRTPRGGQFQLTLPDGTKVWLNAASSITYPLNEDIREVSITGEAYFEVASAAAKPFEVKINDATSIQVLGTHFNINAYTDESAISTTLLQGSVKVVNKTASDILLKPGQQANVPGNGGPTQVLSNANLDQAVAWKNGVFNFDGKGLPEIMRQLSRWYDVEVVFTGNVPSRRFGGEIQRNLQLEQVLTILQQMDVKFRIEGKKLVVLPG